MSDDRDVIASGEASGDPTCCPAAELNALQPDVVIYTTCYHVCAAVHELDRLQEYARNPSLTSKFDIAVGYEHLRRNLKGIPQQFKSRAEEWTTFVDSDRPAQVANTFSHNYLDAGWNAAASALAAFDSSARQLNVDLSAMFPAAIDAVWVAIADDFATWPTFNASEVVAYVQFEADQAIKLAGGRPVSEEDDEVEWIGPKSPGDWRTILEIEKSTWCDRVNNGIYRTKKKSNRLVWVDRRDLPTGFQET